MHSLCGAFNPSAVCKDDGICMKRFPKQFVWETGHYNAQLYITYRQRASDDGGETASWTYRAPGESSTTAIIDNSWVVPYSSRLSIMFQFHLNVELFVSRVDEINYFPKYVCKGNDGVHIQ